MHICVLGATPPLAFCRLSGYSPISKKFRLRNARSDWLSPSFQFGFHDIILSSRRSESLNGFRLTVIDSGFWMVLSVCPSISLFDKGRKNAFMDIQFARFGTGRFTLILAHFTQARSRACVPSHCHWYSSWIDVQNPASHCRRRRFDGNPRINLCDYAQIRPNAFVVVVVVGGGGGGDATGAAAAVGDANGLGAVLAPSAL